MRTRGYTAVFMGLVVSIWPLTAWSQNTAIPGSSFSMGFGVSSGANTTVISTAGEVLVGSVEAGNTRVGSGFLRVVLQQQEAALGVDEQAGLPTDFNLHQNYPNPFNPSTTLRFDLPVAAEVYLVVYDLQGQEVVRLVDGCRGAGYHQLVWDGRDARGRAVPTGLYIARLLTPEYTRSIKLVLLK